jgi:asparagine synthase (glutamine-hydrolysing)
MTAIAGLWRLDGSDDAARACSSMLSAQALYGPHGTAQWNDGAIALGRALYRLVPEDEYDTQPLQAAGGRFVLVGDLRLDNREDLAAMLRLSLRESAALCDAALLLAAFERFGETCLDHVVGDFAFAIWDGHERRLLLARDPLGQRPLSYHRSERTFAFSTMVKGLHALPEISREPSEERAIEFAALLPVEGAATFFKDVCRVQPGERLIVSAGGVSARRYWQPSRATQRLRPADYVEGLRHHLDQAVRSRLRGAGAQVGAHLSAGLDSSAVAATAARLLQHEGRGVVAFTAVPQDGFRGAHAETRIEDEGPYAALTASLYPNIDHARIRTGGRSPFADLDRFLYLNEQPNLNLCNGVWISAINDAAQARGLRVLLTGTMGNFSFSHTGLDWLGQMFRTGRWFELIRTSAALRLNGQVSLKALLANSVGSFLPASVMSLLTKVEGGGNDGVAHYSGLRADLASGLDLAGRARARGLDTSFRPPHDGFATRLLVLRMFDLGPWLKGALAGWGIDRRDPTTDRRLVEFCLSVPSREYLRDGLVRSLARRALADRLPKEVLTEQRKGYQSADWYETLAPLRDTVREEVDRMAGDERISRIFDTPRLKQLVEAWPQSDWESGENAQAYRLVLLRAISISHFLRRASGSNL